MGIALESEMLLVDQVEPETLPVEFLLSVGDS